MLDRLPPLTALRAFDAAARNMSFAKAADELNVTPAALSFQIKSLEEHLGHKLFRRLNRAVELTEAGRALAPGTANAFAALSAAWGAAHRAVDTTTLTITAGPAFTAKWLAPRLFSFAQAHPEIELRFIASIRMMDFDRDEVDVAIRFGFGSDEGLFAVRLIEEWATPMVAPDLADQIKTYEDLRQVPLLHQHDTAWLREEIDWPAWFRQTDLGPMPDSGLRFSQADHAVDAAVAGGGAVMGRIAHTSKELSDGRLVAPFDLALRTDSHYRFVCPEGAETRPQVGAFLEWIKEEVADFAKYGVGRRFVTAPPPGG